MEVNYKNAISVSGEGVKVSIRVIPSADGDEIREFDPWRHRIKVKISEPPVRGKANKRIGEFFEELFPDSAGIGIAAGKRSKNKCVIIKGVSSERVAQVIGEHIRPSG